jgi:hypothetical protein
MNRAVRTAAVSLGCGLLLATAGCNRDSLRRQAVSGTVTLYNQPLELGVIEFFPNDGHSTTGVGAGIANGTFRIPKEKGLSPGTYLVRINAPDRVAPASGPPGSDFGRVPKEKIPEKYNAKTTLTAEVTDGGPNEFTFNLE